MANTKRVQNAQNKNSAANKKVTNADIREKLEKAAGEPASKIKAERDFLVKNLNKDCVGKTFRGIERKPNGDLVICWDVDPEAKNATDGMFHSYWTGHDIGVRNGADAAYLLWQYISLAGHRDFDLFKSELFACAERVRDLGIALIGCEQACDEECGCGDDCECPKEVQENCPQDCDNCPTDLKKICEDSIERDPEIMELNKRLREALEENNELLEKKVDLLEEKIEGLSNAIIELSKRL